MILKKYFKIAHFVFWVLCFMVLLGSLHSHSNTGGGVLALAFIPALGGVVCLPFSSRLRAVAMKCRLSVFWLGFAFSFLLMCSWLVTFFGGAGLLVTMVTPVIVIAVMALALPAPFAVLAYFVGRRVGKEEKLGEARQ